MTEGPSLSVVMPVLNAMPYLDESIASILAQTHREFEFIILDDFSTDGSRERLREWADRDGRIRLIESDRNLGPAGSSNAIVKASCGALIARMDADDVADPHRLERQLAVFEKEQDVAAVGTLFDTIDRLGRTIVPADEWRLVRRSPFAPFSHGSMMVSRHHFERAGGYREGASRWEDVDLFLRLADTGRVLVIRDVLMHARQSAASSRLRSDQGEFERAIELMHRCLAEQSAGRDYDRLLEMPGTAAQSDRIGPRTLMACRSPRLWAGETTDVRSSLRTTRLGFDRASAAALTWGLWADVHPSSLRRVLRSLTRLRTLLARPLLRQRRLIEWQPPRASQSVRASADGLARRASG